MITQPTVLVFGAGASIDYGFPTATQLINEIWHEILTVQTTRWFPFLNQSGFTDDRITNFRETLRRADPTSVDEFLAIAKNEQYREIGKTVMAVALIRHEQIDTVTKQAAEYGATRLYTYISHHIGTNLNDFLSSARHLTVITFNYDRSLEYYLYQTLCNRFGAEADAMTALEVLRIVHVYGTLCPPEYLSSTDGRPFTNDCTPEIVARCCKAMHLAYETANSPEVYDLMREPLGRAKHVCFLGFRYGRDNLKQLPLNLNTTGQNLYYGTAYGLSPNERSEVERSIAGITLGGPTEKCVEFLSRSPTM